MVELVVSAGSRERQVADKAKALLRSRFTELKEPLDSVNIDDVVKLIGDIHARIRRVHSSTVTETLSLCSIYLARVSIQSNAEASVVEIYTESLNDFITRKKSALNTGFFEEFIRRYPTTAWNMRSDLIDLSTKAINVYRRCQVFQLVQVLITRFLTVVSTFSIILPICC